MFVLENHRIRDKYEQKILFKLHLSMVKGKRNGLTFTECSVKIRRFHRHIENEATTMQRNRSAHSTDSKSETKDQGLVIRKSHDRFGTSNHG